MNVLFYSIRLAFITITALFPSFLFSQLSGNYTIGGASPNYASVSAAVTALNSQGISNSVIFNIRPGTYSGQITINAISGVSATKTVTFQSENGDSSSVIIAHASSTTQTNNYTLRLNNSDYINFKKVTIQRTGSNSYSQVIDISDGATRNKFQNSRIIGNTAASTATYASLVGSTNAADDSYNEFTGNLFQGGSYGLYYLGRGSTMLDLGLVVRNNTFKNQYYRAMHITAQSSPDISMNIIEPGVSSSSFYGIYVFYCDNALKIIKNKIDISSGGIGIYVHNSTGSGTERGLIANNFVSIGGNAESNGIYIHLSSTQNIYYNSVNLYSTNSAGKSFHTNGATVANLDLRNNIFCASGGGYAIYVSNTTINPILFSDNNDLYTTGSKLGFWKADGDQTDLNAWKNTSTLDAHSVSADPGFISSTDLHATSGLINNAGTTSLSSATPVTDDIDNQSRSTTKPDIGADEFSVEDLGVSSVILPDTVCKGTSFFPTVYIRNYGNYDFSGNVPVYYQINAQPIVNANTGIISIPIGDSISYTFSAAVNAVTSGTITFNTGTNLQDDINLINNTYSPQTIIINDLPAASAGSTQYICPGDSVLITATGGDTYIWSTGSTLQSIYVSCSDTTVYNVTVYNDAGCAASDSVLVIPYNLLPATADFSYSVNGLYVTLTNNSINADDFLWVFGDGNTDTISDPVHMFADSGSYTITLYASNLCYTDSMSVDFIVSNIEEPYNLQNVAIFPNPSSGSIFISGLTQYRGKETLFRISNLQGSVLFTENKKMSNDIQPININFLISGVYIIEIVSGEIIYRRRLTIIK